MLTEKRRNNAAGFCIFRTPFGAARITKRLIRRGGSFLFGEALSLSRTAQRLRYGKPQIALDNPYPHRYNANVPIGVWKGAVYDERSA
jgi:hypothetical protein